MVWSLQCIMYPVACTVFSPPVLYLWICFVAAMHIDDSCYNFGMSKPRQTGRKPKLVSCWFPAPCGWLHDYSIVHHKIVAFFRVTSSWWPEFSVLIVRMVMWDCLLSTSSSFSSPPPQVIAGMDFLRWHYPHIPGITFIGQMVMLTTLLGFCLEGICTTAPVPLAIWYCVVPTGHPHQWVNWRIKLRKVEAKLALLWSLTN